MYKNCQLRWDKEADVVVVGYGGAGAITAITAYDSGAKVLLLEKQDTDTLIKTRHTPNTRMSGGSWFCPNNIENTVKYLESMVRASNETLDTDRRKVISVFMIPSKDELLREGKLGGNNANL